jgi:hypothetical protein
MSLIVEPVSQGLITVIYYVYIFTMNIKEEYTIPNLLFFMPALLPYTYIVGFSA